MKIDIYPPLSIYELGQRANQEDAIAQWNNRLFVLCDGMGGHEKGEVASQTVCQSLVNWFQEHIHPDDVFSDSLLREALEYAYTELDKFDDRSEEEVHVHAKRITLSARLRPLYRVAACLALVAVLGVAVERPLRGGEEDSDATAAEACVDELDPDGITPLDIRSAEVASKGLKSLSDPLMVADSAALP